MRAWLVAAVAQVRDILGCGQWRRVANHLRSCVRRYGLSIVAVRGPGYSLFDRRLFRPQQGAPAIGARQSPHRCDEPVAFAWHGLYVEGLLAGVAEGFAQLHDCGVERVVEVDECV